MTTRKKSIPWYSNADFYELHLDLSKNNGIDIPNRRITIKEEISSEVFSNIELGLSEMEAISKKEDITIRIKSVGGSVVDALAIIGLIRKSPCKIIAEGFGEIMSSATLIIASCDKRSISQYSYFMYHEMSYGTEGTHSQNKAFVEQAEKEAQDWASWMSEFSNQSKTYWYNLTKNGDVYLSPKELIELGVIDEEIKTYKRG